MKRGFTLIELIVYIAIASLVVLIAGRMYVDSVSFRVDTKNKLEVAINSTSLVTYIEEDLRRLGAKTGQMATTGSSSSSSANVVVTNPLAYWNEAGSDFSSFQHTDNGELDAFAFRSAHYNTDGSIAGVQEIGYSVDSDGNLIRTTKELSIANPPITSVIMAHNIVAFNVQPGVYTTSSTGGGLIEVSPDAAPQAYALSKRFATTATVGAGTSSSSNLQLVNGTFQSDKAEELLLEQPLGTAKTFPIVHGKTYTASFTLNSNDAFRKNFDKQLDTLAACVRKGSNVAESPLASYKYCYHFYAGPIEADGLARTFDFSTNDPAVTTVALVFRFRFSNTLIATSPEFAIGHIRFWEKSDSEFDFLNSVTTAQKNDVKALRLNIRVNIRGEEQTVTRIIQIPNNGV